MDKRRKSGQLPAFGDWDQANQLPITQYFENARQAGLIRHSSSGEFFPDWGGEELPTLDRYNGHPPRSAKPKRHRPEQRRHASYGPSYPVKREQKQEKWQPNLIYQVPGSDAVLKPARRPKPVDEDLYQIPPELLYKPKRKKMAGFLSCLVPGCF